MSVIDNAIAKINAEMQKNADDKYTEIIGQYVIDRCLNAAVAERVALKDKTLRGAMDAVIENARRAKNKNGVAVLLPKEVFGAVDKYFGLPTDAAAQTKALAGAGAAAAPSSGLNLSVEDFF